MPITLTDDQIRALPLAARGEVIAMAMFPDVPDIADLIRRSARAGRVVRDA